MMITAYNNKNDGHGGKSIEHRKEMQEIASAVVERELQKKLDKTIDNKIQEQVKYLFSNYVNEFINSIHYDVEEIVKIQVKNINEMFIDKRAQKFISDSVTKQTIEELKKLIK